MIERQQCKHFLAGRCTRGFNCRYRHVQMIKDPRQSNLGDIPLDEAENKQNSAENSTKKYYTCTQLWKFWSIHLD